MPTKYTWKNNKLLGLRMTTDDLFLAKTIIKHCERNGLEYDVKRNCLGFLYGKYEIYVECD